MDGVLDTLIGLEGRCLSNYRIESRWGDGFKSEGPHSRHRVILPPPVIPAQVGNQTALDPHLRENDGCSIQRSGSIPVSANALGHFKLQECAAALACRVFFTNATKSASAAPRFLLRPTMRPWASSSTSTVVWL